jgi:cytoskeletal protein CcmA (bactofilin family)
MGIWGRKDQEEPKPQPQTREAVTRPEPTVAPTKAAPAKGAVVETSKAVIGPSIQVKGELIGDEDLVIEGKVEGVVRLKDHHLVVGKSAQIDATLEAKSIRIEGTVRGDVLAKERVELANDSTLTGDIVAPRMMIADGARFKGSVDMDRGSSKPASDPVKKPGATTPGSPPKPAGVS